MKNLYYFLLLAILISTYSSVCGQKDEQGSDQDSVDLYFQDSINYNLIIAAAEGNSAGVIQAIDEGAVVDATTDEGVTALMYASQEGYLEIVKLMLNYGAGVNLSPYSGVTALIGASIRGNEDIADLLIQNGADVNATDHDGISPLLYASAFGYYILSDLLIFYDADITDTDNDGNNAIHIAAFLGFSDIVALLIEKGLCFDRPDKDGFTPLMLAAQQGNMEVIKLLVENGSDVKALNQSGVNALMLAVAGNHEEVAVYLEQHGALKGVEKESLEKLVNLAYGQHHREILKNIGIRPGLAPYFERISINLEMSANGGDFLCGGGAGISDSKNNLNLNVGYQTRPWTQRILLPIDETFYLQLWETRSWCYVSLSKDFYLFRGSFASHGISIGVRELLTYGEYRGSRRKVDKEFLFAPQIGWFSDFKYAQVGLGYEYLDLNTWKLSPHRLSFTMKFFINLMNQHEINNEIYWLE